jgi:hypothetical protein
MANPAYFDTLKFYYSVVNNPPAFADTSKNCMDDYLNHINPDFRRLFAATQAEVNVACRFKHIWHAPRPLNSEWTSGVYGVDEEKYDCVDNDGDGWIDEDLIARRPGTCWSP